MKNTRKAVTEFKRRLIIEVRRQKKLDMAKEQNFRREKLPKKYIAKILYKLDNEKFKEEYFEKLEKNWQKWKSVSLEDIMSKSKE